MNLNSLNNLFSATVLLVALSLFLPNPVYATDLDVRIHVAWNNAVQYNIVPVAYLCDAWGIPLDDVDPIYPLIDGQGDDFSGTFFNVPGEASKVLFVWQPHTQNVWRVGNPSGTIVNLNWGGETLLQTEVFLDE